MTQYIENILITNYNYLAEITYILKKNDINYDGEIKKIRENIKKNFDKQQNLEEKIKNINKLINYICNNKFTDFLKEIDKYIN
jgi:hypothetical protein